MRRHSFVPTEASTFYELGSCLSIVAMIELGGRFRYREKQQEIRDGVGGPFRTQHVVVVEIAPLNVGAGARVLIPATNECRRGEAMPR
jgi:hypothetical protein